MTPDEKYLIGKKKNGEIKSKYKLDVMQISDYKYNYSQFSKTCNLTVFYKGGGLFTSAPCAERCVTIYGPITGDQQIQLNFEFLDSQQKPIFIKHFQELIDYVHYKNLKK